ncbi:hypothetical protein AB0D57_18565 [Streptomyces sp. NPDC048275]|uniref:hypothetical protein n=1 Tax=Streptomyces sp. NPDC048275 TaxID=3155629 RepID=UPI0033F5F007
MIIRQHLRQAPKSGLEAIASEDAAGPIPFRHEQHGSEVRLAVADGTSGSAVSGWWAQHLVRDLCVAPGRAFQEAQAFDRIASHAALRWPSRKQALLRTVSASDPKSWLARHRIGQGPSATVLALRLCADPRQPMAALAGMTTHGASSGTWQAVAVGDSCLFQVRDGSALAAFPTQVSRRNPAVVTAAPGKAGATKPAMTSNGSWIPGDVFYLMTDALARWCGRCLSGSQHPWSQLDNLCEQPASVFNSWVHAQREAHHLQDDDITVLRAECLSC